MKELNIDFIGDQNQPLTKEEQLEISAFIKKQKDERRSKSKTKVQKGKKQRPEISELI